MTLGQGGLLNRLSPFGNTETNPTKVVEGNSNGNVIVTETQIPVATYKTYQVKESKYGKAFDFKYPSDWEIDFQTDQSGESISLNTQGMRVSFLRGNLHAEPCTLTSNEESEVTVIDENFIKVITTNGDYYYSNSKTKDGEFDEYIVCGPSYYEGELNTFTPIGVIELKIKGDLTSEIMIEFENLLKSLSYAN